jgi:hypothetical protein
MIIIIATIIIGTRGYGRVGFRDCALRPPPLSMGRRSFATSLTFLLCVCRGPIPDAQYKPKIAVQTFWQQHASFFDKQFGFGVVSPKF